MKVFTVHAPHAEAQADPDRIHFVRDGFYFWAFVFGPFWIAYHRMWWVLLFYVVLNAALEAALHALGIASIAGLWISVLIGLLLAWEGGTLRRWTLARRGHVQIASVIAPDLESAEHRYFTGLHTGARAGAPAHQMALESFAPDIIGSFPQPQGAMR